VWRSKSQSKPILVKTLDDLSYAWASEEDLEKITVPRNLTRWKKNSERFRDEYFKAHIGLYYTHEENAKVLAEEKIKVKDILNNTLDLCGWKQNPDYVWNVNKDKKKSKT
jgi:hypothetical protein